MIYSVKGTIIHKESDLAVIECNGVGYACRTTYQTLSKIGSVGEDEMLFTYLHVREDAIELFGFATKEELNCFKMLISVSGVGPKVGIAILSDISPERFALFVASGDAKAITKAKGVGIKLAQRIILELKDKIVKEQKIISGADFEFVSSVSSDGSNLHEAVSALVVLGYSQTEASSCLSKCDPAMSVEDMIKIALKQLAKF